MIRTIVFDLDDTLFPERDFVRSGFRAVARHPALASAEKFDDTAWHLFETGRRNDIFNVALETLEIPCTPRLLQELLDVYRGHRPDIELFDDAKWAIERFSSTHRLGALSDGFHETQKRKVEALRLERLLDPIIYSDAFGRDAWKPSPKPYLEFMKAAGCDGSECCYVGDNAAKDFVSANQLGWTSVHIVRPGGEYAGNSAPPQGEPHWQIASLYELEEVLSGQPLHQARVKPGLGV
jgi:putative hydrolase of the HAD superfamily